LTTCTASRYFEWQLFSNYRPACIDHRTTSTGGLTGCRRTGRHTTIDVKGNDMREPLRLTSITGVGESRFRVEVVDDDVLVLDVVERLIHRIPGVEIDELLAGRPTPSLTHLPEQSLAAVRAALAGRPLARRRVLISGGVLAASGIVTLGLPFAIAAASPVLSLAGGETELRAIVGSSPSITSLSVVEVSGGQVQVLLRATDGGDGAAAQNARGGRGAYVAATIADIPATGNLFFRTGAGGDAGEIRYPAFEAGSRGGSGGTAVAVSFGASTSPTVFLAVAGAGGGAGGGHDGGAFGQSGSGAGGGGAGTDSAVGAAGTRSASVSAASSPGGGPTQGYPGHRDTLFSGGSVGGDGAVPSQVSRLFGGGGGAGYYQGGGGGDESATGLQDGGGGGGGSNFFSTTVVAGTPRVTSSQVFPSGNPLSTGVDVTVYYTAPS
jgi:hypothetical protein